MIPVRDCVTRSTPIENLEWYANPNPHAHLMVERINERLFEPQQA